MKVGTTNKESYVCTVVYLVLHFHSLYLLCMVHIKSCNYFWIQSNFFDSTDTTIVAKG